MFIFTKDDILYMCNIMVPVEGNFQYLRTVNSVHIYYVFTHIKGCRYTDDNFHGCLPACVENVVKLDGSSSIARSPIIFMWQEK